MPTKTLIDELLDDRTDLRRILADTMAENGRQRMEAKRVESNTLNALNSTIAEVRRVKSQRDELAAALKIIELAIADGDGG